MIKRAAKASGKSERRLSKWVAPKDGLLLFSFMISPGIILEEDTLFSNLSDLSDTEDFLSWLQSIDAILVLGGGVPLSPTLPPVYVQRRCDVVAHLFAILRQQQQQQQQSSEGKLTLPSIICLSAGTAHLPQYITSHDGLPLWESTASAAYLIGHATHPIPEQFIFAETTSYDTISNAFFARTTMTDLTGWRKLLVVTNEFHVQRSKAIFDWIFNVPLKDSINENDTIDDPRYELYYLSCKNVGLEVDAIEARRSHEAKGERNIQTNLSVKYKSLKEVWEFLTTQHDFYSAGKLVKRAINSDSDKEGNGKENLLKLSYGRTDSAARTGGYSPFDAISEAVDIAKYNHGKLVLTLHIHLIIAAILVILGFCSVSRYRKAKFRPLDGRISKSV